MHEHECQGFGVKDKEQYLHMEGKDTSGDKRQHKDLRKTNKAPLVHQMALSLPIANRRNVDGGG